MTDHTAFAMVPRVFIRAYKDLPASAKWFYTCLKDICGEKNGECFHSLRSLSEISGINKSTLASKEGYIERLKKAGLIRAEKKPNHHGPDNWHISIIDIWEENDTFNNTNGLYGKTGNLSNRNTRLYGKTDNAGGRLYGKTDKVVRKNGQPGENLSVGCTEKRTKEEEKKNKEEEEKIPPPPLNFPSSSNLSPEELVIREWEKLSPLSRTEKVMRHVRFFAQFDPLPTSQHFADCWEWMLKREEEAGETYYRNKDMSIWFVANKYRDWLRYVEREKKKLSQPTRTASGYDNLNGIAEEAQRKRAARIAAKEEAARRAAL